MRLYLPALLLCLLLRRACVRGVLVDPSADAVGNISCQGEPFRHICPSDLPLVGDIAVYEKVNTSTSCNEPDIGDTACGSLPQDTDRSCFWRDSQCDIDVPSKGLLDCQKTWDYAACEDCFCVQANQSTDICNLIRPPSTQSGFLWSPNYPDTFRVREEPCNITISLEDPGGSYLLIQVEEMVFGNDPDNCDMEPNADYLKIDATSQGITREVALLCHNERVNISARGEDITFTFQARSVTTTKRFLISYRVFPTENETTTETSTSTTTASVEINATASEGSATSSTVEDPVTPPPTPELLWLLILLCLPVVLVPVVILLISKRVCSNKEDQENLSNLDTITEMTSIPDNLSSTRSDPSNSFQNAVNGLNEEYDNAIISTKDATTNCSEATDDLADDVTIANGRV